MALVPASALTGAVEDVAPALLGWVLRAGPVAVRLTEVEAYAGSDDPASHAFRGPTPRNALMFGPAGRLYVYFTYGMHWCANVVTGPVGEPSAVLLRAGEVVDGLAVARSRRPAARDRDLCRGPARLAKALALDRTVLGTNLLDPRSAVHLEPRSHHGQVLTGPRVGVRGGADTPWRFWLADEASVSPYRPAVRRVRP